MGLPKINYLCIVMYKQLYLGAKVASFCLTPKKKSKKEIAHIVDISQSTLSREFKRNGSPSGKYVWFKAHDKAMERRKRSTSNAALAPELVWRIKQAIIGEQWSPRQISGALKREGVSVSHQSIYNIIHADATGELASHTRHKLKYSVQTIRQSPNKLIIVWTVCRKFVFLHFTNLYSNWQER